MHFKISQLIRSFQKSNCANCKHDYFIRVFYHSNYTHNNNYDDLTSQHDTQNTYTNIHTMPQHMLCPLETPASHPGK